MRYHRNGGFISKCFPTGNHQPRSVMIPPETSRFGSIPVGIATLNRRLQMDDALSGNELSARSCRGARDAGKGARHIKKGRVIDTTFFCDPGETGVYRCN